MLLFHDLQLLEVENVDHGSIRVLEAQVVAADSEDGVHDVVTLPSSRHEQHYNRELLLQVPKHLIRCVHVL